MKLISECVSHGHPDRLCDLIVKNIVNYVINKDDKALCNIECAIYKYTIYLVGRIAAGVNKPVISKNMIKTIIYDTFCKAGYRVMIDNSPKKISLDETWQLNKSDIKCILNVDIVILSDEERNSRVYSDDQNVVHGYALNFPITNFMPVEHYMASIISAHIAKLFNIKTGPIYKVFVELSKENKTYKWERLSISIQHSSKYSYEELYSLLKSEIDSFLAENFTSTELDSLSILSPNKFVLDGIGVFITGRGFQANGLSGRKLCLDYYGVMMPIGGDAIYGKDPYKADVCGAYKAREVALLLLKKYNYYSVFVTLTWSPGEQYPNLKEAYQIDEYGTKMKINDSLLTLNNDFSIEQINKDLHEYLCEIKGIDSIIL